MRIASPFILLPAIALLACGPFPEPPPDDGGNGNGSTEPTTDAQAACRDECRNGCCTEAGACVSGTSQTACGRSGRPCVECPSNQQCRQTASGGQCQACGPSNCDGCCTLDGTCRAGTADEECGNFGDTCVECTGFATCSPTGVGGGQCD